MLTADLAMSWQRGNRISPRCIDADAPQYLNTAEDLILIITQHVHRSRAELEKALDQYVGIGTDYRILRGLIKLLLDRCEFETVAIREPMELRQMLFLKARAQHPVITAESRQQLLTELAVEMECESEKIHQGLYADLSDQQQLTSFEALTGGELLDRYNLAQAQALLYRCVSLHLSLHAQQPAVSRRLFAEIKACRLIHSIHGSPTTGYEIRLNGPISLFHRSQKYGIQMALLLPILLHYPDWQMRAEISTKNGTAFFELSSEQDRFRSHYFIEEIPPDSPLIENLLSTWNDQASDWAIARCAEVIDLGESAFAPDIVFTHSSGKSVRMELLGYWTPRYLQDRLKEFKQAGLTNYILAASEEMLCSRDTPKNLPASVLSFKKALPAREVRKFLNERFTD
jgi:hypothetical protein